MNTNIGETIKTARKAIGMKQRELAEKSGTSQSMIAQYESGKRTPKIESLNKIYRVLGLPTQETYNNLQYCPHCAVDGIKSFPIVGFAYGMHGLIATCECPRCGNATWKVIDHGHFIKESEIEIALREAKKEWNRK